jgi:phenylacetate-CoA ligase
MKKEETNRYENGIMYPKKNLFSEKYYQSSLSVLEKALFDVPFYWQWKRFDPGRDNDIDLRYIAMPVLDKSDIRRHPLQSFLPRDRDLGIGLSNNEISLVKTSGTTSEMVTNVWNQDWWNGSERASWKLNSYTAEAANGDHREAILTSSLNVGFLSDDVTLPTEKRKLSRFLFLNEKSTPLLWSSKLMDRMINELELFKPVVLEVNPSYLAKLCRYVASHDKSVFQPKIIVFTYEYPLNLHLKQIQRVFDAPLVSSYGSTEVGYVFMECEFGKYHQNSDFCRVDFQPFNSEHGGPDLGRILVTTFNNPWYYIIRFNVGDLVRIDQQANCPCGRESGWILSAVEGRVKNITFTCDGRVVTLRELDNALSVLTDIDEYQLYQLEKDSYNLHFVSQKQDKHELSANAKNILHELYGEEAKIAIIYDKIISPEISGKYSVAQTLFPVEIENLLDDRYVHKNEAYLNHKQSDD